MEVTDSYVTWTGETGWNLRTTGSGIRAALQDTIASNPGSITSTFNTVNGWNAGIAAFKPTSSGGSNTGVMTWNPNGTLQTLQITDPFNSANAQTCNFTYDDLGHQSTANCGNAWNQSFSFDPFGNISKSATVGISFNATYSSTTNRILTIGSLVPTYDANGNLTNDTAHVYTWDADGHMLSVDAGTSAGVCDTYDALGRMVEKATGTSCTSSYTQIVYTPSSGRLATMTGQTLQQASVPLIGGAEAVYNSSGLLAYRHSDHLGSSRFASTPSRTKYFDVAYAPYGEDYADSGTTDLSFTGQKKDTASWLYDFMFRKYNAAHGRWMSPDPAGLSAVSLEVPQTWNRYAYVGNNPLSFVDPQGLADSMYCWWNDGMWECIKGIREPEPEGGSDSGGGGGGGGAGGNGKGPSKPPSCLAGAGPLAPGQSRCPANNGVKQTVCSALPQGRVTSLNGSVGLVGGEQGSVQQVVNYNNGEVSNFFTGGLQGGWNGGASASASAGFIYKSGGQFVNSDFSGPFNNVSGSAPEGPGGSVSWASNGVKIVQGGVGVNLIPGPTGNYSRTWTSRPFQGGNVWTNLPSPLGLFDLAIYGLREAAGCGGG